MKKLTLNNLENSYVALSTPTTNFSSSKYLAVGNNGFDDYKSLLKFNFDQAYKLKNISKVEMYLYISDVIISATNSYTTINVFDNDDGFSEQNITWNNTPQNNYKLYSFNVDIIDKNKYISIDITAIAIDWVNYNIPNNGITLIGENKIDAVVFDSSRGGNEPYLIIYY